MDDHERLPCCSNFPAVPRMAGSAAGPQHMSTAIVVGQWLSLLNLINY